MTLYAANDNHKEFFKNCFQYEGYDPDATVYEVDRLFELIKAMAPEVSYFVGPTSDNPKYYMGAFIDDTGRATLECGISELAGPVCLRDTTTFLSYLLEGLDLKLLEVTVAVNNIKMEWFLRGVGFKKAGTLPDKIDNPDGTMSHALVLYLRKNEFLAANRDTFKIAVSEYRRRKALGGKRAARVKKEA